MNKKAVSGIMLTLLSINMLTLTFDIRALAQTKNIVFKIGLIPDVHWHHDASYEMLWQSGLVNKTVLQDKLDKIVYDFNHEFKPDFVLQYGDLIHGGLATDPFDEDDIVESIEEVKSYLLNSANGSGLNMPLYLMMGNHEYRKCTYNKTRIRLAMNDTWELTSDTWYKIENSLMVHLILNTGYAEDCNGCHEIPEDEIDWLNTTLNNIPNNKSVFVHMHVPIIDGCNSYDDVQRQGDARDILESHDNVVAAFFGHCHHCFSLIDTARQVSKWATCNGIEYYHLGYVPGIHVATTEDSVNDEVGYAKLIFYDDDTWELKGNFNTEYEQTWIGSWNYPCIHDIAITNLTFSKTIVGEGYPVTINITSKNLGLYTETFNITAYANSTAIGTEEVTLSNKSSTSTLFTWDTTGFTKGDYTISAYGTPISGDLRTDNNNMTGGPVKVTIKGDVNGDGVVDIFDLSVTARCYGYFWWEPEYDPEADINGDGVVDMRDLVVIVFHWGQTYP